jgi:ABC-2 type transport system permease protein
MALMSSAGDASRLRGQFAAVIRLRWHVFTHSLRTVRGRMELVAWIFIGFGYSVLGIGGTIGLGVLGWYLVSHNRGQWFAIPLWLIFIFWQTFPVISAASTENFDASNFPRFPLSYRSYFMIRMAYGALDPITIIGSVWLAGMAIGAGIAAPRLFCWFAIVAGTFAALNILLARMIFSWIERWLARRKSREIFAVLVFILIISLQFISPLTQAYIHRYGRSQQPAVLVISRHLVIAQRFLPPGLASEALSLAMRREFAFALGAFVLLCAYAAAFLALLDIRLRAQYRGENLSEAAAPVTGRASRQSKDVGWGLRGLSGPVAAIFEKEFHYLSRSGPILFTLVMPVIILLLFRFSFGNAPRGAGFVQRHADFAFPLGAAYVLLILTNLTYNTFGADAAGVQFFFLSPVRFRDVLFAKNLALGAILLLELVLVWLAAGALFRLPTFGVTLATLAGVLFVALVNFIAGNFLSLYAPKRIDPAVFGRQRTSGTTALASLVVHAVGLGLSGPILFVAYRYKSVWLAAVLLCLLAAAALRGYVFALSRMDAVAIGRRETLTAELCRAS